MRPASRSTSSPTSSPTRVVPVAGLRPVTALLSARVTVPRAYADRSTMKRLSLRMSLDVLLATTPLPDRARHVMGPGRWSEVCSEWRDHPCSSFEDTVSHGQRCDAQEDLLRGSAEPVRTDPGAARLPAGDGGSSPHAAGDPAPTGQHGDGNIPAGRVDPAPADRA